jgi:PKD repeat protein
MRMLPRCSGLAHRGATIVLAASMAIGPASPLMASPGASVASARSAGALAVASDPGGATVYVDGQFAGQTPLNLPRLRPGDHRVRLVKDGYLENARVVSITGGKSSTLQIRLTVRNTSEATTDGQVGGVSGISSGGGGGGPSRKWLYAGIAGGAAATAVVLATRSHAPTVAQVMASPTTGLQGGTVFSFSASAGDEDGDSLTYTWNFGDGGTATGVSATHVYTTPGAFNVSVTVSDGKKDATGTGSVTVRALTGTWTGVFFRVLNATVTFTQTGSTFTGTYSDTILGSGAVSAGTIGVLAPDVVLFTVTLPGFTPFTYTGRITDANTLNGVVNGSDFVNEPWTLRRQ